jgi:chromosome segregation ATPase
MGRKKDFMDPWQEKNFQKLKSAAEASKDAAADAVKRKETLSREINELSNELENFGYLLGVDEVLRYQEDVAQAEKKVTGFQTLIAVQEDIIQKARQAAPDSLDTLLRKREDILADISMGKATDKDLKALDEEIAAQDEAVIEFNKTASQANQVIAGLQRKLSAAEDELNLLQSRRQDVFTEFLMGRAEILGEEYVELSMQLIDKYKQLVALDQIIGYPSRLTGPIRDGFAIPTFRLKAFDGLEQYGYYGQIGAARAVAGPFREDTAIRKAVDEMKAEISAAGINL